MMASVSSAAGESRRGRKANWARSMASAYSRRVRNCHPCAISTSSTPWSWAAYASRISASPAWTAAALPRRQQPLDPRGRALHVERAWHHTVQYRLGDERDHPLRRGEQVVQLDHQRGRGRLGRLGPEAAPELLGAPRRSLPQPLYQLPDLLVLEQPAHQLGAWILPFVLSQPARQQ